MHLSYDQFTGLSRFFEPPGNVVIIGAVQKSFTGLHVDTMALAQPVSLYGMPVAGEIEDTFTNILQASQRLCQINDNTMNVYSVELLHAAQAMDLHSLQVKLQLSEVTDSFTTRIASRSSTLKAIVSSRMTSPTAPSCSKTTNFQHN